VYRSLKTKGDAAVFLKLPKRTTRPASVYREIAILATLSASAEDHNVVRLVDVSVADTARPALAVAVDAAAWGGLTLEAACRRTVGVSSPPERAVRLALQAAQALRWLHAHHVIHRDVRPCAFWLVHPRRRRDCDAAKPASTSECSDDVSVKLADVGAARLFPGAAGDRCKLTGMLGTIRMMAPEVYRKEAYSLKADVYSWALLCYWLVEGVAPFANNDTTHQHRVHHVDHSRPRLSSRAWRGGRPWSSERSSLMSCAKALVRRAWDETPELRPSFEDVVASLLAAAAPSSSQGEEEEGDLARRRRRAMVLPVFGSPGPSRCCSPLSRRFSAASH